jgi:hypothetical protein
MLEGGEAETVFLDWLTKDCGYKDVKRLPDGRYACIYPLMFTHAIITVQADDYTSMGDHWCYYTYGAARAALDDWSGTDEPLGWHKHPRSNRCRIDGDPEKETIGWPKP